MMSRVITADAFLSLSLSLSLVLFVTCALTHSFMLSLVLSSAFNLSLLTVSLCLSPPSLSRPQTSETRSTTRR